MKLKRKVVVGGMLIGGVLAGGVAAALWSASGAGGGRKFMQAALTLPSSRARLNAPRRRHPFPADTAWP